MIFMMKIKLIMALVSCILIVSCNTESSKTEYDLRLKGTDYHWKFSRDFKYKITLEEQVQYNQGVLKAPAFFEGNLWAINGTNAQIVRFDNKLRAVEKKGKKGDGYIDENKNFNHFFVGNEFYFVFDPSK